MHWLNWVIVVAYVLYVVVDGIRKSKSTDSLAGFFIANKSLSWWVVGLSVMATQLSAITMIGTPGQGATDGIRFVQFYFGLPIAMVILGVTLVPFLHGSGVFTAYEYLERRFDAKTRSLTAFLFLLFPGDVRGYHHRRARRGPQRNLRDSPRVGRGPHRDSHGHLHHGGAGSRRWPGQTSSR